MNKILLNKFTILFISVTALVFTHQLKAQSPNFEWAKNMGGTLYEHGISIATDASGNIYTTGNFQGTADFNPGVGIYNLTAVAFYDIYISKLDSLGNFIWAKSIGGAFSDISQSIAVDATGNVYITGGFKDTVDFDPGPGTFNLTTTGFGYGMFISKLDSSGNFIFAKSTGNLTQNGSLQSNSIAVDAFSNVYTVGLFNDTVDFDPGVGIFNLTAVNGTNSFFLKLDSTGNFVWAKNIECSPGGSRVEANSLNIDALGNLYATGRFFHIVDFDPGPGVFNLVSPNYKYNIFIIKLSTSGNFVWARSMWGKDGTRGGLSIKADALGNVYTSGSFTDTVDFNPGAGTYNLISAGSEDIFISKLDSLGNFVWAKKTGGLSNDIAYSLALDASGNAYTAGSFIGTADFDPGAGIVNLISAGLEDIFISKLDASGNFVWAKNIGGSLGEEAHDIVVEQSTNSIYTTGGFKGTVDFNQDAGILSLTSFGNIDIFVHKMSQCLVPVVTLNNLTLSTNIAGALYQWINCSNNSPIPGATNQTYTAVANGNYAVVVTVGNCSDTSTCLNINTIGLSENINFTNTIIYPNPTSGLFTIELNTTSEITITNTLGQIVLNEKVDAGKQHINLKNEANGVYFLRMINRNIISTYKIIKQ